MARAKYILICPLKGGTCLESSCAWFLGENKKGDCAIKVLAVRHKIQLDDVKENNHLKRLSKALYKMDKEESKLELKELDDWLNKGELNGNERENN